MYVWKVGHNQFELGSQGFEKRVPVNLNYDQVRLALQRKGFSESRDFSAIKNALLESNSKVSAKEKMLNPGVEVGATVAVKAPGFDYMVKYGKFLRIGPSGLATVILNEPLDSSGETRIAVPPNWLHTDIQPAYPQKIA